MSFKIPTTQKAIRIHETGGLDVLKYEDIPVPKIKDNEVLIKNKYAGVNFIERYYRIGLYPTQKPYTLGSEAVGTIVLKGSKVQGFEIGDYISYLTESTFAQYTNYDPSEKAFKLPKNSTDEKLKLYAAAPAQGLTALAFINDAYNVQKDDYILVTAAAGGVGLFLTQLIKNRGAHVIATASSNEKLKLAKENGAEFLINSQTEDIVKKVLEFTNNKGVAASFDGVGQDTFQISLDSLARKGTLISFGNSSGAVDPVPLTKLVSKNIKLLRPNVFNYFEEPKEWEYYSNEFKKLVESGELKVRIEKIYPLSDYKIAAEDLEGRKTSGKLLLEIPQ
ncbi:L-threonine 3-dehydrogenase [Wickerhamomyces ciferrii]|uniref:Probable quinone oxidoreductase n=1 Tax=Wickerhamomyces ciferrii (strain ATCC 14091 / BCRC 22168 / CBS 111 / JCM 3599 / NBRC 0793 / NRRL Y-1031 F-60-10) TaxID=1206466 RepID=K0KNP5_WICCF|nr:L-threonine 3-dehydrogenase [Wickerhamomyces ciferrii]CCH43772.1 L-threonine 3-dehydrogenase [Wickerhamomyces ciferrii]